MSASYPVGNSPMTVAYYFSSYGVALVVGYYNFTNTNVAVLLSNGNGTFQTPVNYAADIGPVGVAVGDVNGDFVPDIVTANFSTSDISVLLGQP